jgi:hypothetical protein
MSVDDVLSKVNELRDKQAKYHEETVKEYRESQKSLSADIEKMMAEQFDKTGKELRALVDNSYGSVGKAMNKLEESVDKFVKVTDEMHQTLICSNAGLYDGFGNLKGIPQKELEKHV